MKTKHTKFFKNFIETDSKGHDFFPLADWRRENPGLQPQAADVQDYLDAFVQCWEPLPETVPHIAACQAAMIKHYLTSLSYRERVLAEAVEYITAD